MHPKRTARALLSAVVAAATLTVATISAPALAQAATETDRFSHQVGHVLVAAGSDAGYTANVDLYANSVYGVSAGVVVETPDGQIVVAEPDAPAPESLFADGRIRFTVPAVVLNEDGENYPAGTLTVEGTYSVAGPSAHVNGARRDNDMIIVERGTTTPVSVDVRVTYGDAVIPVDTIEAFAYDLHVVRQAIGNAG